MVKLNRRVQVVIIGPVQNDQGGNGPGEIDRYDKWAQIENRTGFTSFSNQQQIWPYDYKIVMRHERTRPTQSNYYIEYEGHLMKINSLSVDSEGYKGYEVCRCSKVDTVVGINQSS